MRKFVNLTPHEIKIITTSGREIIVPPSGKVFRLEEEDEAMGDIEGIEVVRRTFKVPAEAKEMFDDPEAVYIVSLPALMALKTVRKEHPELMDIVTICAPDTGAGAVRDEQGRIVGTRRLITI